MHTRCVCAQFYWLIPYIFIYIITLCRTPPRSFYALTWRECHHSRNKALHTKKSSLLWRKFVNHDCYLVFVCTYHVFVCMFVFWIAFSTLKLQFTLFCCRHSSITISYERCISMNLNYYSTAVIEVSSVQLSYFYFCFNWGKTVAYRYALECLIPSVPGECIAQTAVGWICKESVSQAARCLTKCLPFPAL